MAHPSDDRPLEAPADAPAPRGPGRPRNDAKRRHIALSDEDWQWLMSQPGRASGWIRAAIQEARANG